MFYMATLLALLSGHAVHQHFHVVDLGDGLLYEVILSEDFEPTCHLAFWFFKTSEPAKAVVISSNSEPSTIEVYGRKCPARLEQASLSE